MADYTSRLNLRKPAYTDNVSVQLDVNASMQIIDDQINCMIGTSAAKPISRNGQLFYETDTENILIKHGTKWLLLGNRKFAKGKKALTTVTASGATFTTGEQGPYLSTSFTAELGRKYIVETDYHLHFQADPSSGNSCVVTSRYRWAAGAAVTTAGTLIGEHDTSLVCNPGDGRNYNKTFEFFPNVAGQVTIALFILNQQTTKTIQFFANATDRICQLLVRDYGI